jgi:uncharacterized membrane protein
MRSFLLRLRALFLAGILVTVPVVVTFLALRFLFEKIDDLLGPLMSQLVGHDIPGLGIAATLILVLLAGLIASNYFGRQLVAAGEGLFARLPLVRAVYRTAKDIVGAVTLPRKQPLRVAVMVEYPRSGLYAYGFVTGYTIRQEEAGPRELANVFIPSPPVPTTGALIAVPRDEIYYLDMTGQEAMKLIISGGMAVPDELHHRTGEIGTITSDSPEDQSAG